MVQRTSEVTHEDCVIKGKADGQDESRPNFEQPTRVRENGGNSCSHIYESMTNQQHIMMLNELEVGALKFVSDKFDLDDKGIMIGSVKIF